MNGDLTSGSPLRRILGFCMPLLLGGICQQLYNMVDSIIVGRVLGMSAFAAIGSTGSLNVLVIGFAVGLCTGLCIPIARHFGAGDIPGVRRAAANSLYIAAAAGVLISVGMALFSRPILALLQTPESILDDAHAYIGTLCAGSLSLILYNMVIGFMRAMGDSKTPLFFMILASAFNILLDLLLIVAFRMGVTGAALATVLAQLCAALLCVRSIRKHFPILRLTRRDIRPSLPSLRRLSATALPIGLQCSLTAVGSIFLQIAINGLGAQAVAAVTVVGKVHAILFAPMDALGVAVVFFVSQNDGAGRIDRVRKGMAQVTVAVAIHAAIAMLVVWLAGRSFAGLFLSPGETEIHDMARQYLRLTSFFFLMLNAIYMYRNALQGLGRCNVAMGSGLWETAARVSVAAWVVPSLGFLGACLGTPAAWTAAGAFVVILYFHYLRKLEKEGSGEQPGEETPGAEEGAALPEAARR